MKVGKHPKASERGYEHNTALQCSLKVVPADEGAAQHEEREVDIGAAFPAHPQAAEDFRAGKDSAAGRLVGEVRLASGGKANGAAVIELLRQKLRT